MQTNKMEIRGSRVLIEMASMAVLMETKSLQMDVRTNGHLLGTTV